MPTVTDAIAERGPMQRRHLEIDRKLVDPMAVQRDWVCVTCGESLRHNGDGSYRCACGVIQVGASVITRRAQAHRQSRETLDADHFRILWRQTTGGREMPIKDRTSRNVGLSRAGIIRLGHKVPVFDKDGKQRTTKYGTPMTRPVDVEYFVLNDAPAVAEAYAGYKAAKDVHGSGPTELLVYLPFGDPAKNFDANYEWWQAGGCYCRGNGEFIDRAWSNNGLTLLIEDGFAVKAHRDNEWSFGDGAQVPCSGGGETRLYARCNECRLSGVFRILVRDPNDMVHLVADDLRYYQIRTHSGVTYDRLSEQVAQYARWAADNGMALPGIPFRLVRVPETMSYVATDRNGAPTERKQSDHALMTLIPDEEWTRVITEMQYRSALSLTAPTAHAREALPSGEVQLEAEEAIDDPDGYDHSWKLVEGEVVDEEPEQQNGNGKPTTSGYADMDDMQLMEHAKTTARPWSGDLAAAYLQMKAKKGKGAASDGKRGLLVGNLEKLLGGDDNATRKRHELMLALFGADSSKTLNAGQVQALLDWIEKDGELARQEAERILTVAAKQRGQVDMFTSAEPAPEGEATQPELDNWFGPKDKPSEEAAKAAIDGGTPK